MEEEMKTDAVSQEHVETMDDYAAELEASFKRVREGDTITGTVIRVSEDQVFLDLRYYAEGIINKEDLSSDPDFNPLLEIHTGDEITATVIKTDDGEGNIVLSRKLQNDQAAWEKLKTMMEDRTMIAVKISEIVKGGAVVYLEGIRGFIPASKLAAEYVENLEDFSGKTIDVTVITADEENQKLVLSGKEPALLKQKEETSRKIAKCQAGVVMEGTVDTIKDYGAFINLENGLSGLLHISQISNQRIKHPGAVLKEGQTVKVKIISTADNKISLSMKAVEADEEEAAEIFDYKEEGSASTGLANLLKGLKF
nr:S1 RNA-binding domain-containing protein [uncultured Clostridium sp.]